MGMAVDDVVAGSAVGQLLEETGVMAVQHGDRLALEGEEVVVIRAARPEEFGGSYDELRVPISVAQCQPEVEVVQQMEDAWTLDVAGVEHDMHVQAAKGLRRCACGLYLVVCVGNQSEKHRSFTTGLDPALAT